MGLSIRYLSLLVAPAKVKISNSGFSTNLMLTLNLTPTFSQILAPPLTK